MTSVIELYERLSAATDDKTRARIIAEAFEALEERYPNLSDIATKTHLSETELRLAKEIEETRGEIKETELRLAKEIEETRGEIKETELRLAKEIEETRGEIKATELRLAKEIEETRGEIKETELRLAKEIEETRGEIKETELRLQKEIGQVRVDLTRAIHHQTLWVVGAAAGSVVVIIGAIIGLLRFLGLMPV